MPRQQTTKYEGETTKSCQITKSYPKGCLNLTFVYPTTKAAVVTCVVSESTEYNNTFYLSKSCGPLPFQSSFAHVSVRAKTTKASIFNCPRPEGTSEHFDYKWYKSHRRKDSLISSVRKLTYYTNKLPIQYTCVVTNRLTGVEVEFTLGLSRSEKKGEISIAWILVPAVLIVLTIPAVYLAYLSHIGHRSSFCANKTLEDQVDYMVTQTGGEEITNVSKDKNKKPANKFFKTAMKGMSDAVERISSTINIQATVMVSLPIPENPEAIRISKIFRNKRAHILRSERISPMFKRQSRKICKQSTKGFAKDHDAAWMLQGIHKVENWKIQALSPSRGSIDSVEETLNTSYRLKNYSRKFTDHVRLLTKNTLPCSEDEWLRQHRMEESQIANSSEEPFTNEQHIIDLSDRLMEMYMIAKPHKTYFPTVKKIGDPFHAILVDNSHPSHRVTKNMWDEYMDRMFAMAADVGTLNRLCKKVLERTLGTYGNPLKMKRINSMLKSSVQ
ncbi:uncharacterized protein [Watersipora subatra]|uniref:uncharacterized protein n=1 Tax=Watersipora subatra TaxID=2589382 RepID=UPI00355B78D5